MGCFENWEKASLSSEKNANVLTLWQLILGVGTCLDAAKVQQIGLLTFLICMGPEVSHHVGLKVLKPGKP